MHRYVKLFFVNAVVIIGLFTLSEIAVRVFIPQIQIAGTEYTLLRDSVYCDSPGLNPNSTGTSNGVLKEVNGNGFWTYSKKSTSNDTVLYLGDSITMGIGVDSDSTFAGIINNECNSVVLNASMIGYSAYDYLNVVKKIINNDKNRLCVSKAFIFWCLNDIYGSAPDENSPQRSSSGLLNQTVNFFKRNFKLYYFLKSAFTDRPKAYYLYDEQFYNGTNEHFLQSIALLQQISVILKSHGIPLTVFMLPYEYQLRKTNYQSFFPQKHLADSLANTGIEVCDLCDYLHDSSRNPDELYLYDDGIHFSTYGHKVIANYLKNRGYQKNGK